MDTTTTKTENYSVVMLQMDQIFSDDEFNVRQNVQPSSVFDLAESIRTNGLQTPISVKRFTYPGRPDIRYRIIAGHRRYAACKVNRAKEIPCFIKEGISESKERVTNVIENLHREQLDIMEEAKGCMDMAAIGHTIKEIANKFGVGTKWVEIRLGLLKLPKAIQDMASLKMYNLKQLEALIDKHEAGVTEDNLLREAAMYRDKHEQAQAARKLPFGKARQKLQDRETDEFKLRNKNDIVNLMQIVYGAMEGESLASVVLSFCLSRATHADVLRLIESEAKLMGYNWMMPGHYAAREVEERFQLGLE